jgi:hypothetical protein
MVFCYYRYFLMAREEGHEWYRSVGPAFVYVLSSLTISLGRHLKKNRTAESSTVFMVLFLIIQDVSVKKT